MRAARAAVAPEPEPFGVFFVGSVAEIEPEAIGCRLEQAGEHIGRTAAWPQGCNNLGVPESTHVNESRALNFVDLSAVRPRFTLSRQVGALAISGIDPGNRAAIISRAD